MPEKFWVVWCPTGTSLPDASDKPIRRTSYDDAYARAAEAAHADPGSTVYVMEAVHAMTVAEDYVGGMNRESFR